VPETPEGTVPPTPSPTGNSTPPGSNAPETPPPAPEFRFGDAADVPAWARGKSAKEVLEIGKRMEDVLTRFNQQGSIQPPASYQPPPSQPSPQYQPLADDEFLTGRQVKEYGQQLAQSLAPQFQQATDIAAQTAYGFVRQKYDNDFNRYGPEIQQLLANVPKAQWSLDNLERVVKIVRAEHLDELVDEGIRHRAAEQVPSLRPNGGATESGAPHTGFAPDIDATWVQKARSQGIDEATVREFCAANGMSEKAFYEQFKNGLVSSAVAESRPRTVIR